MPQSGLSLEDLLVIHQGPRLCIFSLRMGPANTACCVTNLMVSAVFSSSSKSIRQNPGPPYRSTTHHEALPNMATQINTNLRNCFHFRCSWCVTVQQSQRRQDCASVWKTRPNSTKSCASIDPKQQQTMCPRRSCAIKNSLGAPFLRKETKEKKGHKPRNPRKEKQGDEPQNPSWNKKEGGLHVGAQCHNTRKTSPTTLPGNRWNQDMLMPED